MIRENQPGQRRRLHFNGTPFAPYKRPERDYARRKGGLPCDGCNKTCHLGKDYYMVHDHVWFEEAQLPSSCIFCITCLETRLGRPLKDEDFQFTPKMLAMRTLAVRPIRDFGITPEELESQVRALIAARGEPS